MSSLAEIADLAATTGLSRIHILAWRDLADVEAGGSELHADRVAAAWAAAGIDVTMRTSFAAGTPPDTRRNGYRVIRSGGRYMIFPRAVLAELAGKHGPRDGLVEIWNGMPFLTPLWARHPRVTWIHQPHTHLWSQVMPAGRAAIGRRFERDIAPLLYRRTPVVTLSESVRDQLVTQFRLRPTNVHVVPPGIDERFRETPKPPRHTPANAGNTANTGNTGGLIVAVGRLTAYKRFDKVILIVHQLRQREPCRHVRLVIAGSGAEHDNLRKIIADLDATSWCQLTGHIDDDSLVSLYQRASVLVAASVAEGWGMTITEAAACGTPAVASNIAGHANAVVDGITGHLANNVEQFLHALERIITDPAHRQRLREAALSHARQFSWERSAHELLAVLAGTPLPR